MPARPAPRDPVPYEPASLDAQLTDVLRATGAHAARAVDGRRADGAGRGRARRRGRRRRARAARPRCRGGGGGRGEDLDDLVVTTGRTVHVLRECDQLPGVVLHVRLDRDRGDVGAAPPRARRAVDGAGGPRGADRARCRAGPAGGGPAPAGCAAAGPRPAPPVSLPPVSLKPVPRPRVSEPSVQQSVRAGVSPPRGAAVRPASAAAGVAPPRGAAHGQRVSPALPGPAAAGRAAAPSDAAGRERQPALVTLTGRHQPARTGALAVLALPPVPDRAAEARAGSGAGTEAPAAKQVVSLFGRGGLAVRGQERRGGRPARALATGLAARDAAGDAAPDRCPAAGAHRSRRPKPQRPRSVPRPAVLRQSWASDVGTMRRL